MAQNINTVFVKIPSEGYILSLEESAMNSNRSSDYYRTAHGKSLHNTFNDKVRCTEAFYLRQSVSVPTILGYARNISEGPDITSGGMLIKQNESWEVALPAAFEPFLPMAECVAQNVLQLYGSEGFHNAAIQFIVQRTNIEPGQAHRQDFGHWHTHLDNGKNAPIDLIYGFATNPPTEFKSSVGIVSSFEGALTRFGAEVEHRSPINMEKNTLRRTWGAFIVYPYKNDIPSPYTKNEALLPRSSSPERRESFKAAASKFLIWQGSQYFKKSVPQILSGFSAREVA